MPKYTTQHYNDISHLLRVTQIEMNEKVDSFMSKAIINTTFQIVVNRFAELFKNDNERFNEDLFRKAIDETNARN